jgi:prostatic aicd phosphatase
MQMYELGSFLRNRYRSYLGSLYRLSDVHAQSTGVSRAKMSLQLVLAGLYPPKGTALEWNHRVNWQPFDIKYQNLNEDSLLLLRKSCPRYHEELDRVLTVDVKDEIELDRKMMEYLSLQTGLSVKTPDDVQSIYSTLKAEVNKQINLIFSEFENKLLIILE